jgi:hypothetical protein
LEVTVKIDDALAAADLKPLVDRLWQASAAKIESIERTGHVIDVDGGFHLRTL